MSNDFNWEKNMGTPEGQNMPPVNPDAAAPPAQTPPATPPAQPQAAPPAPVANDSGDHAPISFSPSGSPEPQVQFNPAPQPAPDANKPAAFEPVMPMLDDVPDIEIKPRDAGDKYVPAAIPKELLEPELAKGKYFVDTEEQEPDFICEDPNALSLSGVHVDEILRVAHERKASDVHLTAGLPPMIRLDGELTTLPYKIMKPTDIQRMVYEILNDDQITKFESTRELDCGHSVKGLARFRLNVYQQRQSTAAALRLIPNRIPSFDELKLPKIVREMTKRTSGLILVTGPTGSGKSTSIAAMLDDINSRTYGHIMTIEDPIEYLHKHKRCMVNQRELHEDTYSFHNALRAVLREDPDIILVGELRDLETIEAALTLAETGHLVFGTLHTRNAPSTIDRIIDVFPSDQQDQIRVLLGNTLEGVVSQQLLPKLGGGRVAALEIMLGVPAIRNLIREGKTHQMYSVIETSQGGGMQTMDKHLSDLYRSGMVSYDECLLRAVDKDSFTRLTKGAA